MNLTTAQQATFRTWLSANASGLSDQDAANLANATASPSYFVWATSISQADLTDRTYLDTDGATPTAFVWGGTTGGFINRSQGERDAFRTMFMPGSVNPSLASVRNAYADIFSGNGVGAVACRAQCWAAGQRPVTNAEKLFVAATVGGPAQSGNRGTRTNPDTLGTGADGQPLQGSITSQQVAENRA